MTNTNDQNSKKEKQKSSFYDVDFDYDEKKVQQRQQIEDTQTIQSENSTSKQLDQSIRKVKSLFTQAAEKNTNLHNPYKKVVRSTQAIRNDKMMNNGLPSPEQIRAEKERRRQLRIAELEQLDERTNKKSFNHSDEIIVDKQLDDPILLSTNKRITNEPIINDYTDNHTSNENNSNDVLEDKRDIDINHVDNEIINSSQDDEITESGSHDDNSEIAIPISSDTELNTDNTQSESDMFDSSQDDKIAESGSHNDSSEVDSPINWDPEQDTNITPVDTEISPLNSEDDLLTDDINTSEETSHPSAENQNDFAHVLTEDDIQPTRSRKKKRAKNSNSDLYALDDLETKSKVIFGFNVFFNVLKKFAIYMILIALLGGVLAGGVGAGYFAYLVSQTTPPTREEMQQQINHVEQQSTLYYANGDQIANVRADVVRTVTDSNNISPYIIDGLIATEDEHFYEHNGVMPKAILRATLQELLTSGSGTGGSTLTQQLVKQQMLTNDVTFFRKANEILLALRVEKYFSKEEILTAYLNISPFGRNNHGENVAGILSASEGIFGKQPNDVTLPQAAFLVGLPQAPYSYTPYDQTGQVKDDLEAGIDRMKEVLFRMYRTEKITKEQYDEAVAYDITKDFLPAVQRSEERQTYLYQAMMNGAIEQIMRLNVAEQGLTWEQVNADVDQYNEFYSAAEEQLRTGGYHVHTTIDRNIYDSLQTAAAEYSNGLGASYDGIYTDSETGEETYYVESVQSGIVVMDNRTGRVLGFVSGTDYENNQIDHAFGMRRSPGSTIKPLAVYGPAVEHNLINPSTIIPDTAYQVTLEDGSVWTPTNYGSVVSGTLISARNALLRSDNLPAVRIYEKLLEQKIPISDYLQKMGFDTVDAYTPEETNNLAFSLGGVTKGPTVFEQTRAFTTFANNGQYIDGYYIDRIEDAYGNIVYQHNVEPVQVFSEDSNYLMVDMLRDTNTQGTGRTAAENMAMGGDWIAKSGISENSRDVWYIASTPAITVGTWIGYDNRYENYAIDLNDGYGRESERIQTYWARVVNDLYSAYPDIFGVDQTFTMPESVQRTDVLQNTGTLPGTISVNGTSVTMSEPIVNEVFKVTNPAQPLNYDFIFNGTEEDTQTFWNTHIAQVQEALRIQQEQQRNSNQSGSSNSSSNANENQNQNENQPQNQPEQTTIAPNS